MADRLADDESDNLDFNEKTERSWRAYLSEFRRDVYPMFEEFGFTFPQAFQAWNDNCIYNALQRIEDK